eukprot:jgi/Psemu1/248943/estExt_Genewise1.C_32870003
MMCYCTMEDITEDDGNYVEYQTYPSGTWHPCQFERSIVEHLLKTQFNAYVERVHKTDCKAELRRLLEEGPPVWLSDPHALPLPGDNNNDNNNDTHVCKLWYAGDDIEVSAKLENAVEGDERRKLWDELKLFMITDGTEDDNDDDDDDEGDDNDNDDK